jgi:2-deoxy-D-gluconate 3-dehydrogenase
LDFDLEGKVAIVTGAGRGLGREAARALAAEGALILATARSQDELHALAAKLTPRLATLDCDVADPGSAQRVVDRALEEFGRLDILVNNAGIAPVARFLEQDWSVWDSLFAVNVTAAARLCQAAARHFNSHGGGKVINVASTAGILGKARLAAYSASKGALILLTRALAAEWASIGIQVNAIAPGAFDTAAQEKVTSDPDVLARRIRKIPARRMADASEIGPLVCYLASPLSNFVTGAVYVIDGGETAAQ